MDYDFWKQIRVDIIDIVDKEKRITIYNVFKKIHKYSYQSIYVNIKALVKKGYLKEERGVSENIKTLPVIFVSLTKSKEVILR